MGHDWLLVETLGDEPAVVANGRRLEKFVPISAFLRKNPYLSAMGTAIAETVQTGQALTSITPKSDCVIRTEPVIMSDDRIHGVQVWIGPIGEEPPERPIPGALMWDLNRGVATDTPESLANDGQTGKAGLAYGGAFAKDLPSRELNRDEAMILALVVMAEPGRRLCSTWDISDEQGNPIRIGFTARSALEPSTEGPDHVIARAINWRAEPDGPPVATKDLVNQILAGLAEPGVHRALVDFTNRTFIKWLDEPCPFYDSRPDSIDIGRVHPGDADLLADMTAEFSAGTTAGVLRLPGTDGGWVPVHVTVNRVQLEPECFAGLVSFRLPTDEELADQPAGSDDPAE
ncbi:PAS domain-containing protein [Mycobacterium sp.]|uniref:PAS domain-containing protein n=1 Tax=Mycobacterium sp. TaxID=1785 RepID=UPI003A876F68